MQKKQGRLLAPRRKDGSYEFDYTPSHSTDVRKTFERVRAGIAPAPANVQRLPTRRR